MVVVQRQDCLSEYRGRLARDTGIRQPLATEELQGMDRPRKSKPLVAIISSSRFSSSGVKEKSTEKIDGAIATIMVLCCSAFTKGERDYEANQRKRALLKKECIHTPANTTELFLFE